VARLDGGTGFAAALAALAAGEAGAFVESDC